MFESTRTSEPLTDESLSSLAFGLRTALNNIIGFSELICYGEFGKTSREHKTYFESILASAKDIIRFISVHSSIAKTSLSNLAVLNRIAPMNLYTMSFRFRTSLNNIHGYANLIHEGMAGKLSSEQDNVLQNIISESETILSDLKNAEYLYLYANKPFDDKALSDLAFKLRTSMNNIIGFSELMYAYQLGKITEEQKMYLNNILLGSKEIVELIPDKANKR